MEDQGRISSFHLQLRDDQTGLVVGEYERTSPPYDSIRIPLGDIAAGGKYTAILQVFGPDGAMLVEASPLAFAYTPLPTLTPEAIAGTPSAPSPFEWLYTANAPVVALTIDTIGNLFIVTSEGEILRRDPAGDVRTVYLGLTSCGFSLTVATALPNGELVVSDCVDNEDRLIAIDEAGSARPLTMPDGMPLAITSDAVGRIYLGIWLSEGDLSVNFQPFQYLAAADFMQGQIIVFETDGTQTTLYEGGLPFALDMDETGTLFASIWGQSGGFAAQSKEYSVCDPRQSFWITLSDQVSLEQTTPLMSVISSLFSSMGSITAIGSSLFVAGAVDGECGIYRLDPGQTPQQLVLPEAGRNRSVTSVTSQGTTIYFANIDGEIYRADSGAADGAY
jgi:hypothetical protein